MNKYRRYIKIALILLPTVISLVSIAIAYKASERSKVSIHVSEQLSELRNNIDQRRAGHSAQNFRPGMDRPRIVIQPEPFDDSGNYLSIEEAFNKVSVTAKVNLSNIGGATATDISISHSQHLNDSIIATDRASFFRSAPIIDLPPDMNKSLTIKISAPFDAILGTLMERLQNGEPLMEVEVICRYYSQQEPGRIFKSNLRYSAEYNGYQLISDENT